MCLLASAALLLPGKAAQAQVVISTNQNDTVILPAGGGTATINSGVTIAPVPVINTRKYGIVSQAADVWTIINNGKIATDDYTQAVYFEGAGTLNNYGEISVDGTSTPLSGPGGPYGVYVNGNVTINNLASGVIKSSVGNGVHGATFTLTNAGTITGAAFGRGVQAIGSTGIAHITNSGTLSGGVSGVDASNAQTTIINQAGGQITGTTITPGNRYYAGIVVTGGTGGYITNDAGGVISGTNGISSYSTAYVVLTNAGTITGSAGNGLWLSNNGAITNQTGGTVTGQVGALIENSTGTVTNAGTITGTTAQGIWQLSGGAINNQAGGAISGTIGIQIDGGSANVTNAGTITGSSGTAIQFRQSGGFSNSLTLDTGSLLNGNVLGGDGFNTLNLQGTGTENAAKFIDFDTLVMRNGQWTLTGNGTFSSGAQVQGGTLIVTGTVTAAGSTFINAGATLQFGDGGASGMIPGPITNNGTLAFNRSDVLNYNEAIAGGGGVVQMGTGTVVLGVASSYSGPTIVRNGTLAAAGTDLLSAFSSHVVETNGTLDLRGFDQTLPSLTNAGIVQTGGLPGTALTVGIYTGQGGSVLLNTVLGADNSPTDRLVITGSASGSTLLHITDIGGSGAITLGDGIRVVEAASGATTDANAFSLGRRVAAGAYEYQLYQGGNATSGGNPNDQSWYLRNTLPFNPGDPGSPDDPNSPVVPNVRVEVPLDMVIPPLAFEYGYTMLGTLHERVGDTNMRPMVPAVEERIVRCNDVKTNYRCVVRVPAAGRDETRWASSGWARLLGERGFHDSDNFFRRGADYSYTLTGIQAGLDLYGREQADGTIDKAGIYVGFGHISSDVKGAFGGKAGSLDIDAYTVGGYWTHHSPSGWYSDAVVQGTWYEADAKSVLGQRIKPEGFGIIASLEGGYAFKLGNNWTLEPQAQLAYQNVNFDSTHDQFGFIDFDTGESLRARLGVRLTKTWNMADEVKPRLMTAWLRANVWHEFLGKTKTSFGALNGQNMVPFTTSLGGTWGEIGAGVSGQITDTISVFATGAYQRSLDNRGRQSWDGRLGMTVKW